MKYLLDGQESDRLFFRLLKPNDYETWLDLFKEKGVAGFLAMDDLSSPEEQCTQWFEKVFHRYENDLGGMNVLVDKKSGDFIG